MKTAAEIRQVIARIPGAIYEADPDEVYRGYERGVSTLWEENGSSEMPDAALSQQSEEWTEDEESHLPPVPVEEIFEHDAEIDEDNLIPAMDGEAGERIRKSVMVQGVDGLAWYVTFHAKGAQWGIYIPVSSIIYMIYDVFDKLETDC